MSTCSSADFPFVFYDTENELVNGTLVGDSCIFPDANCDSNVATKECCGINGDLFPGTGVNYMYIGLVLCFVPYVVGVYALYNSMSKEEMEIFDQELVDRQPRFITKTKWMPAWLKNTLLGLWEFGIGANTTAFIVLGIFLKQSEQANMTVTERNSLAASEAFMEPFYTIFTFVEDIILIRVSYAMAKEDKGLTDRLIHMGLAGVIVTGLFAGLIGTLLGIFGTTLQALTIPGLANDKALYPGCSFIETVDVSMILPYWLMESWACMGTQIGGVLSGFLMGAWEYNLSSWIGCFSLGAFSWIWFGNVGTFGNPLTLLAIADSVKDWLTPLLYIAFLVSPLGKQIRERTGLDFSAKKVLSYVLMPFRSKATAEESTNDDAPQRKKELTNLLKQGLKLMFIDIILQACMSCSKYLSLHVDSAVTYQLTALESDLPQYGHAYAFGMALTVKVFSPTLMSNAPPSVFVKFVKWTIIAALLLIAVVIGATVPSIRGLALNSGKNACAYASSSECLPFFDKVMGENGDGGIYTLPFTYYIFPIASSLEVLLLIFRAILLTCLDFDFMLGATVVAGISYIPAILIVQYASLDFQQQAIGYFAAVYVPQTVLILCCVFRLVSITRKMKNDEPGPWSPKQERRVTRLESIRISKALAEGDATDHNSNTKIGADEEKSVYYSKKTNRRR